MLLDLLKFYRMFPNYDDFKIPMWSDWEEKNDELILSVAVPGYEKEDFELFSEDGGLYLRINNEKKQTLYSIVSRFYASAYDFSKADAGYRNGILKITIPKVSQKKQKAIPIKVS